MYCICSTESGQKSFSGPFKAFISFVIIEVEEKGIVLVHFNCKQHNKVEIWKCSVEMNKKLL